MKRLKMNEVLDACGIASSPRKFVGNPVGGITAEQMRDMYKFIEKRNPIWAKNFAEMINDLPSLKPEEFIEWCWRLDMNWWWDRKVFLRSYSAYYEKDLLTMVPDEKTVAIQQKFKELITR